MQNKQEKKLVIKAAIVQPTNGAKENIVIENFKAKNNMLTARIKKEDSEFMLMHSSYDPEKEADSIVSNLDFSRHGLFVIFGVGLGYHLKKIVEKASLKSIIVVIEQSRNICENFLKNINSDFLFGDSRVAFINAIDPGNIGIVLETLGRGDSILGTFAHNIQYVELNYHKIFFGETSPIVIREIAQLARMKWKMLGNCHVDHNIGVIQPILNIDDIVTNAGIDQLKNCYEGKSAIIVSAGPSLDKNMIYLAQAKGKMFIAAVDAVLPKLLKNNIIPDAVVTVERLGVYKNVFKKMECEIPKSIILMAPALTEVNTLKLFKKNNKIFFFQSGVGSQKYYDEILNKGELLSGTCAAYTALSFCKELGFKKIAFVGQDLAYAEDGRIYCDGISKEGNKVEEQRKKESWYTASVKDYNGKDIPSNVIWKDQLRTFELFIKVNPRIKVYDATEGGAKIEGSKIVELKEYIEENEDIQLEDINLIIKKRKGKAKRSKKTIITELYEKLSNDYKFFVELRDCIDIHFNNLSKSKAVYVDENKKFTNKKIDEAVELINVSQEIINKINESKFLKLYYQGLIINFKKDVNQISEDDFESRVRLHIKIHYEFFELLNQIFRLNLGHIKFILEFLEGKIKNEPLNDDIIEILRGIAKENGIDPEFVYRYFHIENKEDNED